MNFSNSCKFYNFSSAQKVVKVVRNLPKCCKTQWISQILATFTTFATFWKKFPWGSPRFSRNNQLVGLGQIEYTKPLTGGPFRVLYLPGANTIDSADEHRTISGTLSVLFCSVPMLPMRVQHMQWVRDECTTQTNLESKQPDRHYM